MATAITLSQTQTQTQAAGVAQPRAARAQLWREVLVFFGITLGMATVLTLAQRALGLDIAHMDTASEAALALIPILAAAPGVAAVVTRLAFHRTLRGADWGLRWRGNQLALVAGLLPLAYVPVSFFAVYAFGLGGFDATKLGSETLIALGGGVVAMGVLALLEEIGWRGFLVPALVRLVSGRQLLLLSGLAWAVFHYPLLLFVQGGNHGLPVWYGVPMFTLVIMAANVPYVWLRLRSGSLWPAVVLHTIHNALIYSLFEPLTVHSEITAYAQGEQGFTLLVVLVVVGAIFWRPAVRAVEAAQGS